MRSSSWLLIALVLSSTLLLFMASGDVATTDLPRPKVAALRQASVPLAVDGLGGDRDASDARDAGVP